MTANPPETAPEPRTWDLPVEPGPEVTCLRSAAGHLFERNDDGWRYKPLRPIADIRGTWYSWRQLLVNAGPLTDATEGGTP